MLTLPNAIVSVLIPFATLFSTPAWRKAQVLLAGAILTPGQRTVAAALRVMGRSAQRDYARYHEVLNRGGAQPGGVVAPPGGPHPAGAAAPAPGWWRRPSDFRHRRYLGTASRSQDQASGHLPGRGALQPPPTGQGQRPALNLPDVAGPRPLGRSPLGLAGADGAGAIDTLLPAAGTPAQKTHRLGAADDFATAPLAAPAPAGAGGRQRLCRAGPAPLLSVPP